MTKKSAGTMVDGRIQKIEFDGELTAKEKLASRISLLENNRSKKKKLVGRVVKKRGRNITIEQHFQN